jgi:hypothetical protein
MLSGPIKGSTTETRGDHQIPRTKIVTTKIKGRGFDIKDIKF